MQNFKLLAFVGPNTPKRGRSDIYKPSTRDLATKQGSLKVGKVLDRYLEVANQREVSHLLFYSDGGC